MAQERPSTPPRPDVLYPGRRRTAGEPAGAQEPAYFHDLGLDRIVDAITSDRSRPNLAAVYWSPLSDLDTLVHRQQVFADLDRGDIGDAVRAFIRHRVVTTFGIRSKDLREDDGGVQHHFRTRLFLNAAADYCQAVVELAHSLSEAVPRSLALCELTRHLADHTRSEPFRTLHAEATRLESALAEVHYVIAVRGDRITVADYDGEVDYGARVAGTFARFRAHPVVTGPTDSGRVWETYAGTGVLDLLAQLHPELFAAVERFCTEHWEYVDPVLAAFDHDVQFYLAYLDHIAPLRAAGLQFSYPRLSETDKQEQSLDAFDLALAHKLQTKSETATPGGELVTNDLLLRDDERIMVVSGPNNGGKTTMARMVGQLHHLARLGCPVPGRDSQLFVCDRIFTHFERMEDSTTMTGRLQAELDRLRADLAAATSSSLFILNEVFSSTTAADALYLSRRILDRIGDLDALCVCVTFLEQLGDTEKSVSMVSEVDPSDPTIRTHKVVRRPADGRAYARAIADKHGLGYDQLVEELSR